MKKIFYLAVLLLPCLFFSCKPERLMVPSEPVKNISGDWQIIKATRNGTDMTGRFDFTHFRVAFTDSTYSIDSLVPFIVNRNGRWSFDDPQYPFNIAFVPTDSASKSSGLQFPVTNGVRNLIITFSPGCAQNSYQYTLRKAN